MKVVKDLYEDEPPFIDVALTLRNCSCGYLIVLAMYLNTLLMIAVHLRLGPVRHEEELQPILVTAPKKEKAARHKAESKEPEELPFDKYQEVRTQDLSQSRRKPPKEPEPYPDLLPLAKTAPESLSPKPVKDVEKKEKEEEKEKEICKEKKNEKDKKEVEEKGKGKPSKEKPSREKLSKEKRSKERESKEKASKEKPSKEKASKERASKEKGSKEKVPKDKDDKAKTIEEKKGDRTLMSARMSIRLPRAPKGHHEEELEQMEKFLAEEDIGAAEK